MRAAKPISLEHARELVLAACQPLDAEPVALARAHHRVLAQDVFAASDVPRFTNSSMDGYAVKAGGSERELTIVGEARAGTPWSGVLGDGEAIRISTGAPLPPGAEGVLALEDAKEHSDLLTPQRATTPGEYVRHAGEDMRAGALALARGTTIGPFELAVAIGAGVNDLLCTRRPRVVVLTTGSELREPGTKLGPGEIHDSNLLALSALSRAEHAEVLNASRVSDDPAPTRDALEQALQGADVVTIAGGVSVGRHDHVKTALEELGVQEHFWGVQIRPGRPTWFGVRGSTLVFGLPGNPVSATVIHVLLVRAALRRLQGADPAAARIYATLGATVRRNANRAEAVRVTLRADADAEAGARMVALPTGAQESHVSTSLLGAQGLAFVGAGENPLEAGALVEVELL